MNEANAVLGTDQDVEALSKIDLERLSPEEAQKLHKALAGFIERDRNLYYNSVDPVASDNAYDVRLAALKRIEDLWPSLSSSPRGGRCSAPGWFCPCRGGRPG